MGANIQNVDLWKKIKVADIQVRVSCISLDLEQWPSEGRCERRGQHDPLLWGLDGSHWKPLSHQRLQPSPLLHLMWPWPSSH